MTQIKTLTMYLPQFHRTPDNDAWWGEGFTEWTAVRAAKSLFEGHMQPRVPLNKYYYNLLEKETMQKQAEWMHQYGVDGQCFYHYYFENGRMTLEKPAENLLKWTDIDMPFCFCWANTTWARTWSNIGGNTWADEFEKKDVKENDNGVLLFQKYGREREWKKHFDYLVPFFRDDRYIKVEGHPIFMITWVDAIPCLRQMIEYWRLLAVEERIPDIYIIGMGVNYNVPSVDAVLIGGPHSFWNLGKPIEGIFRPKYDEIWQQTLAVEPVKGCKTFIGGFTDYDDTGRRGRHGGIVTEGFTIEKFYEGMKKLYKKNILLGNEFVFINAWNEWGEGMYLEPDENYRFSLLDAVRKSKIDAISEIQEKSDHDSFLVVNKEVGYQKKSFGKAVSCFNYWMTLRENGKCVTDYLVQYEIENVAVYGYGALGKHLVKELDDSEILIKYIIDRNVRLNHLKYDFKTPDEFLPHVDAIIVTPVDEFDNIYDILKSHTDDKIISLLEIMSELM